MKRCAAFLILLFSCLSIGWAGFTAEAVSIPYAVIGEDVWMLEKDTGEKLFLLPRTYYARIDRMDETFYYVTFNGFSGKIPKVSVSVVGYDKPVRDTQRVVKLAPEYSVFTEIKLRLTLSGDETVSVPTGAPLAYVGTYKQGESTFYFVASGEEYGYVLNTYTDTPVIQIADFLPETEEKENEEEESKVDETKKKKNDVVKIAVIGGVSAVALVFVVILFLPRKSKKHKYYYS